MWCRRFVSFLHKTFKVVCGAEDLHRFFTIHLKLYVVQKICIVCIVHKTFKVVCGAEDLHRFFTRHLKLYVVCIVSSRFASFLHKTFKVVCGAEDLYRFFTRHLKLYVVQKICIVSSQDI